MLDQLQFLHKNEACNHSIHKAEDGVGVVHSEFWAILDYQVRTLEGMILYKNSRSLPFPETL